MSDSLEVATSKLRLDNAPLNKAPFTLESTIAVFVTLFEDESVYLHNHDQEMTVLTSRQPKKDYVGLRVGRKLYKVARYSNEVIQVSDMMGFIDNIDDEVFLNQLYAQQVHLEQENTINDIKQLMGRTTLNVPVAGAAVAAITGDAGAAATTGGVGAATVGDTPSKAQSVQNANSTPVTMGSHKKLLDKKLQVQWMQNITRTLVFTDDGDADTQQRRKSLLSYVDTHFTEFKALGDLKDRTKLSLTTLIRKLKMLDSDTVCLIHLIECVELDIDIKISLGTGQLKNYTAQELQ